MNNMGAVLVTMVAVLAAVLISGASLGHAQVTSGQIQVSGLRSLRVGQAVALPPELANAQLVAPEAVPETATFRSLQKL